MQEACTKTSVTFMLIHAITTKTMTMKNFNKKLKDYIFIERLSVIVTNKQGVYLQCTVQCSILKVTLNQYKLTSFS